MIHLETISKRFGPQVLFSNVDLHIGPEDRIGLVGANGTGKTTLFRVITGEGSVDDGTIKRNKGLRIGYLPQEMDPRQGRGLFVDVVDSVRGFRELQERRAELEAALHDATDEEAERIAHALGEVEERFQHIGGYTLEAEAREVLIGLGFSRDDFERPLSEFSGGWHMRVELAKILLNHPDLLLLDEPTNHLDLESMQWFESYLATFKGSYVIVAHDRAFLNRTVRRIVDVGPSGLREYPGSYDRYRRLKTEEEALLEKRFQEQQVRIRELEDFIARNRTRKDRARQVQSRIRQLEKMEKIELPRRSKGIRFQFPQPPRSGNDVLRLEGVKKRYGDWTVFGGIDLHLLQKERVALVGQNGAGKSTLLKILAGRLALDGGERVLGANVHLDYFAQHQLEALHPENTVFLEMLSGRSGATMPLARAILGAFLFSGDDVDKKVMVLSGGEKSRLALAKLLLAPANLLILDEPTNHLDIDSREVLEAALSRYEGTLVFTSHDRAFINVLATKVVEVAQGPGAPGTGSTLTPFPGNYDYYAWKRRKMEADGTEGSKKQAAAVPEAARDRDAHQEASLGRSRQAGREKKRIEAEKRNRLYRKVRPLREELERLEAQVARGEERLARLEARLKERDFYLDPARSGKALEEYAALKSRLEKEMARWAELAEKIETLEAKYSTGGD